jgi:hypothetical protein
LAFLAMLVAMDVADGQPPLRPTGITLIGAALIGVAA